MLRMKLEKEGYKVIDNKMLSTLGVIQNKLNIQHSFVTQRKYIVLGVSAEVS